MDLFGESIKGKEKQLIVFRGMIHLLCEMSRDFHVDLWPCAKQLAASGISEKWKALMHSLWIGHKEACGDFIMMRILC